MPWIGDKLERLSFDSEGRRIPKRPRGMHEIKCNPTRAAFDDGRAAEDAERAGAMHAALDSLTDEERLCIRLHESRGRDLDEALRELLPRERVAAILGATRTRIERRQVTHAEEPDAVAAGWSLVSRSARYAIVEKSFPVHLGYAAIAVATGLTVNQARARVLSAWRKLRAATAAD